VKKLQLKIDEEFKSLIPPLTAEEFQQLKENIIKDGCRDALVIWNETIIDGHNRYRICTENEIEFQTVDKHFDSRDDATEWIIRNQFGRRNITTAQRCNLVLVLEPIVQAKARENLKTNADNQNRMPNPKSDKASTPINTNNELAKAAGVGHNTIHQFRVIKNEGEPELFGKVLNGEVSINKAYQEVRKPETKDVVLPETKTCSDCHEELPISEFYIKKKDGKPEGRCKECSKRAGIRNRTLSGVPSELRNISDEQLIGGLYDIDNVPEYTIRDLVDEVSGKVNEFNRVINIIIEGRSELLQSESDYLLLESELTKLQIKLRRM
jgi:hypothetical protein